MAAHSQCTAIERVHAVACSAGIRGIVNLSSFLGVDSVVAPSVARQENLNVSMVVVWGRKETSQKALMYANEHNIPVVYIEDGWIRTASADAHSRRVYSLLVDNAGVYYDCHSPSELENLLNLSDTDLARLFGPEQQQEAKQCRELLVCHSITKYNFCKSVDPSEILKDNKPLILIVDQTVGDASLTNGGMTAEGFKNMLIAAVDDNPDARLVVRTHPDVVSGRKSGYLTELAQQWGLEVSAIGDNPMDWLKKASKVYVGTSQIGYEALLCGAEVHVFGLPFYAGWGLTTDYQELPRRIQKRTVDELFFAAHMKIARYCHPVTGTECTLRECLQHVCLQKHEFERNAHHFVGESITLWKRRYLKQFLRSPKGSVRFSSSSSINDHETRLTWSFRDLQANTSQSLETNQKKSIHRIEDGFLRSKGLGSDFVAPASIVVDSKGIYFDPSAPSDLEVLLQTHDCTLEQTKRAAQLIKTMLATGMSKYNVGQSNTSLSEKSEETTLLVVGQVSDDESIRRGAVDIRSNLSLCEAVRAANPSAHIVFKPHPDVVSGNRDGAIPEDVALTIVDEVATDINIVECFEHCDEIHTITSQSGFEALLRRKRVVTYGLPFYAGWGLTQDRHTIERRSRVRTLEELVYCCLVAYPKYLDFASGEFIRPEDLIDLFSRPNSKPNRHIIPTRAGRFGLNLLRKANNISKALTYKAS